MIHESYSWKEDLLKYRNTLQKYKNNAKAFTETKENIFALVEKCIFYSAFVIRKLIDCKHLVSDGVDNYSFHLTYHEPNPQTRINQYNKWPDVDNFQWKIEKEITISGYKICNQLIHSYVFFIGQNEQGDRTHFYVSSDQCRNMILYKVPLNAWISYIDYVVSDSVSYIESCYDEKSNDYKFSQKKRTVIVSESK